MQIKENAVVAIHYTVANDEGEVIDSSADRNPLTFICGHGYLISGLENALQGKTDGDEFVAEIPAADAYGEYAEHLCQQVPKEMFEGVEPEVGMRFRATTEDGEESVIITDIGDDYVEVDGNHPLAGYDLTFDVKVISVREASAEEIATGEVVQEKSSCCDSEGKNSCCD